MLRVERDKNGRWLCWKYSRNGHMWLTSHGSWGVARKDVLLLDSIESMVVLIHEVVIEREEDKEVLLDFGP